MTKVLIGEISSYKAMVIAKYLFKQYPDIEIYTFDYFSFTGKIHSKYSAKHFVLKFTTVESYIVQISELVKKLCIDLFIPVHSDFIEDILKQRKLFGSTLSYIGNYSTYKLLHNKKDLHSLARKLAINVPIEYEDYRSAKIPFVAKPSNKSSSKGVLYINDAASFERYKNYNFNNYVFQEYVEGIGCGYSIYCADGEIIKSYGHKRLAEYPVTGGSSVYRDFFYVPEMKEITKKILAEVKWTGFAMFEFKCKKNGELVLIEVNPRIWGSINQGQQNGVNYFESLIGETTIVNTPNKSYKTYLSPQVYLSLAKYILKGKTKPLLLFLKNFKNNKADVNLFDDFKGYFSVILRFFYK